VVKHIAIIGILLVFLIAVSQAAPGEVVWAVNCGGDAHTDQAGIVYQRDPLQRVGVASDFGRSLVIQRVPPQDQILYQTERYHTASFSYDVPITRDGDYVVVLKFCEVWFTQPNQKVCFNDTETQFFLINLLHVIFALFFTAPVHIQFA
jgi:hypothetical protein